MARLAAAVAAIGAYPLRPLAEAPAIELNRALTGDEQTPYADIAELTRRGGRYPGEIAALAAERAGHPFAQF